MTNEEKGLALLLKRRENMNALIRAKAEKVFSHGKIIYFKRGKMRAFSPARVESVQEHDGRVALIIENTRTGSKYRICLSFVKGFYLYETKEDE